VQDYAILVVSAPEGIQSHTRTLWQLLRQRNIPTFIFVNKCDLESRDRRELLGELSSVLSPSCVSFMNEGDTEFFEDAAAKDERLMAEFFETECLSTEAIASAIRGCRIFPCYFGSALKMRGVSELLSGIEKYTKEPPYSKERFGAKVYKISRDAQGRRISFAKITGGKLYPKDTVSYTDKQGNVYAEKVEEIRVFSGEKSKAQKLAEPGTVCALYGLTQSFAGLGLGTEVTETALLSPVLDYRIILPKEAEAAEVFPRLCTLAEEDPTLYLRFDSRAKEIRVSLMGDIQKEVLTRLIKERLSLDVGFDRGAILYKETVASAVHGAGHFEPLRHYAEVHLIIEPLPEGSGIVARTECDRDSLATAWQRLVLTHIEERAHKGVLTGSPLTDVKITLVAGKAHLKHTEGGDFRQATYRAIRQGLMKAENILLEPTFDFKIELPSQNLGRVLTDLSAMGAEFDSPEITEDTARIEGCCPVYTMRSYPTTLRAFTAGNGRISLTVGAYRPAHNAEEVIAERGYDPESDERNLSSSVFCKGGAGYSVPWNEADALMHLKPRSVYGESADGVDTAEDQAVPQKKAKKEDGYDSEKELMKIFEATYGKIKPRIVKEKKVNEAQTEQKTVRKKPKPQGEEYLILDGYNVIYAWEELSRVAERDLSAARDMLINTMCSYAAFRKVNTIIVFDAYRRKGGDGSIEKCGPVTVVYTKEAQTADAYIEKTTYQIAQTNRVRVVTSDLQEQYIILGHGALRVSAKEFKAELQKATVEINEVIDAYKLKRS